MSPDDLAAAFEDLARSDPQIRIDGTRAADGTVLVSLAAGRSHPDSSRRFCSHAIDAARLFDPGGQGNPVERWLSLVWKNAPELVAGDRLGGAIKDAARASAIVVRRLRVAVRAMRRIPEQQVRGAAGRLRDILSLLTWAYTLSEAGWRHSYRPAGQDIERLCPDGRALYGWLLREIMGRTGLSRGDLEIASCKRRGIASDELRLLERDDPGYLAWLLRQVRMRFPSAVEFLPVPLRDPDAEVANVNLEGGDQGSRGVAGWLTVTKAAEDLAAAVGLTNGAAKTRVTRAANAEAIVTNGEKGKGRLIEPASFHDWLRCQIQEYHNPKAADSWARGERPPRANRHRSSPSRRP